jgi:hypothetical protein
MAYNNWQLPSRRSVSCPTISRYTSPTARRLRHRRQPTARREGRPGVPVDTVPTDQQLLTTRYMSTHESAGGPRPEGRDRRRRAAGGAEQRDGDAVQSGDGAAHDRHVRPGNSGFITFGEFGAL